MNMRKVAIYFLTAITVSWFVTSTGHALDKEQRIKDQINTPTSVQIGNAIQSCNDQIPACKTCELTFTDCHVEIDTNGEGNVYGNNKRNEMVNVPAISCQEDDPCYGGKLPHTT